MKIGIVGCGNVGGTLGKAWSKIGHVVLFGFRNASDPKALSLLAQSAPTAMAKTVAEAVAQSEVIVLATPWEATEAALINAGDLSGKVLIDATNPLLPGLTGLSIGTSESAGEKVAKWAKGARVVKAFNTVGFNIMADPHFPDGPAALPYCGDDPRAKQIVAKLSAELGFQPIDAGPLSQSRLLEPFALLWITLALKQGFGREIGFKFMQRSEREKRSSE